MSIQDRYILRTVLGASGVAAVVLLGISAFFVFIGELHDVGKGHYGIAQALVYIVLSVPQGLYQLLPVIVLLGALLGLGGLAGGSELVVFRASGVSVKRLAGSALMGGMVLALLACFLGNWLGPRGERMAHLVKARATAGRALQDAGQGVWLRDKNDYVYIGGVPAADRMVNVRIYQLDDGQAVTRMLAARSATYDHGKWRLHDVKVSRLSASGVKVGHRDQMDWSGRIQPSLLRLFVIKPENLTTAGLWRYAHYMKANGVRPGRYALAFWSRMATPFTVLAMVLLAVPFVLGPLRSVSGGQRLFVGVLAGLVFFLANQILDNAGQVYGLAPWAVAWGPTLLLAALGAWGVRSVD